MKRVTKIVETAQIFCSIVSTIARARFGFVALFADYPFLRLPFAPFLHVLQGTEVCREHRGQSNIFFQRTVAVCPCNSRVKHTLHSP